MSITTTCMVINLRISMWEGRRLDRAQSRKVVEDNHATDQESVRVNKLIVAKTSLDPLNRSRNNLRGHFLERTLPWRDNGDRVLYRKMFPLFIEEHETLVRDFMDEKKSFLRDKYPVERDRASFRMGTLFNPDDYPRADELEAKFYVRLEIEPICEANDFRVDLDNEQTETIKAQIEASLNERVGKAMGDVWERLTETVEHYANKMGTEDAIFRDTTVTNLVNLIDVLPGLNLLDDPNIKTIRKQLKAKLYNIEPKELRKNPELRAQAAADAQEIIDQMKAFMGAMGQ